MSTEYDAWEALKDYLVAQMDADPQTDLTDKQIVVDYPDADNMPYPVMLYIVPESGNFETLTTNSLLEQVQTTVYIVLQNSTTHREMSKMIEAIFDYFGGFMDAINNDETLGNAVGDTKVNGFTFYPAISSLTKAVGLEITITIQLERV